MNATMITLFFAKKAKAKTKDLVVIYFRITIAGKRFEISTMRSVKRDQWYAKLGKLKGTTEESRTFNSFLDSLRAKAFECQKQVLLEGKDLSVETFRSKWMGESSNECPKILEVFDDHNAKMKQLVDVEYSPETLERYIISRKHTQTFIQQKYKVSDIRISDLNYEFITNYEFWLKSVRKCEHNTTMKYLSNFRKIVNICLKNGWINRDPFYGYKMAKRVVDREYLTADEIQRLISRNFNLERLSQVRDIFLFSCFTGLAFADVEKLNRKEIVVGVDGEKWISTNRQKTDAPTRIPLLPQAIRILEKYENHPQCLSKGKLLPVMSNQKMNAYLKEVGDLCEIEKKMTFHMARHTFATTVTLTNGVPIETVSKLLGHRNLKTTQHYAKIIDKKVSDDLKTLKNKIETTGLFG